MFTIDYIIFSVLIAIFAFVYTNILTEPGEILSGLKTFLHNTLNNEVKLNRGEGFNPLYKVLIGCEKCVAGQVSLWSFFIVGRSVCPNIIYILLFQHVLFITLTIFITILIKSIHEKLNN